MPLSSFYKFFANYLDYYHLDYSLCFRRHFSLGVTMLFPTLNYYIANMAPSTSLGAYFGFSNMSMAIGGSIGNLLGGMLYDLFTDLHHPELFWGTLAILCLFVSFIAIRSKRLLI
ncbi:MFS transporter [Microbacteriaceae bacterium 4G12]